VAEHPSPKGPESVTPNEARSESSGVGGMTDGPAARVAIGIGLVGIAVIPLFFGLIVAWATWTVRGGAAEVTEEAIEADFLAGLDAEIHWDCQSFIATGQPTEGVTNDEYLSRLRTRLESLGYEAYDHRHYAQERDDMLDANYIFIDVIDDRIEVEFTIFDTDSALCTPNILAKRITL